MITDLTARMLLAEAHAQDIVRIDPAPLMPPPIDLDRLLADICASVAQAEQDLAEQRKRPPLTDDQVWWIRQRLMLDWR